MKSFSSKLRLVFLVFAVHCSLFTIHCLAGENITIQSDTLEYKNKISTYTAKGNVRVLKDLTRIDADEIRFNEKTSDVSAEGNVVYEDADAVIKAKRAELNLESKTGMIYEAEVFIKRDNYHITGYEIEKKGEKEYAVNKASFTTCDSPVPEWCFKGNAVNVVIGDRLKAKDVTFNIRNQPVLYSPYFTAALDKERKAGFLFPSIGYVESKGIHYQQPFFWAISENRDATFMLDIYGLRGIGEGVEYRHIERDGSKGNYWLYHIRDEKLDRDFWDLRGIYENRDSGSNLSGYLNLNYINSRVFYDEYSTYISSKAKGAIDSASYLNMTTGRFLESTGEVSLQFDKSRLYLTSRHLIDLKAGVDSSTIAQRLPEVGYFINPQKIGPVVFSLSSSVSNFWRDGDASGQRLDVYPRFTHSFGSDIAVTQRLGLRETAYSLTHTDEFESSPHREGLDYNITANARLFKKYGTFTHIAEPSLGYTFASASGSDLPLFDSTELYSRTSRIDLSVLNRFMDENGEFLTLRITQPFDALNEDRPFMPMKFEAALKKPVYLRGDLSFNVHTGEIEGLNSDIAFSIKNASFSAGERYNRSEDILFYSFGISYMLSRALSAEGNLWYDAKDGGLKDMIAKIKYKQQCWGATMVFTKRQDEFSISVLFDLLGLGSFSI